MGQHSLTHDPSGVNLFQNLGYDRSRRAEATRPVGPIGSGFLGTGSAPSNQLGGLDEYRKLPRWGRGEAPATWRFLWILVLTKPFFPGDWSLGVCVCVCSKEILLIILVSVLQSAITSADFLLFFIPPYGSMGVFTLLCVVLFVSLFACLFFVSLFVCTITDFSAAEKGSGVKLCILV